MTDPTRYILGLDLGPPGQPTALAAAEQHWPGPDAHYHVRHLRRWTPGTPYPQVVADVVKMTNAPPLCGALLAVDQTGVGRPVAELLQRAGGAYELTRVVVSFGYAAGWGEDGARLVPKRDLVGVLQVLFQARRLRVAGQLPETGILERELLAFRAKTPTAGTEVPEAWREGPHDDLVLAVAFACWLGEWLGLPNTAEPVITGQRQRWGGRMVSGVLSMIDRQPLSPRFRALRAQWEAAAPLPPDPPPQTEIEFTIWLDLGKLQDYSALCVVERTAPPEGEPTYAVRHLRRWPLGTAYTTIAADVAATAYRPALGRPRIAADATGVGQTVMEMSGGRSGTRPVTAGVPSCARCSSPAGRPSLGGRT